MPTLRFHGLSTSVVKSIGRHLSPRLSSIVGCPDDWFAYEVVHSTSISHDGTEPTGPPIVVDLLWFSRGQEVQDRVATEVTTAIRDTLAAEVAVPPKMSDTSTDPQHVGPKFEIVVIATSLAKTDYYEDGQHFG